MKLRHVVQAVCGVPWAIQPEKLAAIGEVLAFQAQGGQLSADEIKRRIGEPHQPTSGAGSVAVLPLFGIISHRAGMVSNMSGPGGTSTETFGAQLQAAVNDPNVSAIIIDVDSPGGNVEGVQELASQIYQARASKPVIAVANAMAASAAYWIASAATELWVTPSGSVGSIGVYAIYFDESEADAADGVKATVIKAGKFKAETAYGPLSDEAVAAQQDMVDTFYDTFTRAVATYRGVSLDDVVNGFGEGRIVLAKQALAEGMVDKIGTLQQAIAKYTGAKTSRTSTRASASALAAAVEFEALAGGDQAQHAIAHLSALISGISPGRADVAAAPILVPHASAVEATKETTMPEPTGAAAAAPADTKPSAAELEHTRVDALIAFAAEEAVTPSTLREWQMNGTTLLQAQKQVLEKMKAAARTKPALSASVTALEGGDNGYKHGPYRPGISGLGEQLSDIVRAATGAVPERLANHQSMVASATGASATVGADGGFLIQKDHDSGLMESAFSAGDLLSRVDNTELSENSDSLEVVYLDETSRANGSRWGGVQVFRVPEAPESVTSGKPQLGRWDKRVDDLEGIAYMTERLLADAPAMADVFSKGFSEEFKFVIENELYRGTGAGQCLGLLNTQANSPTVTIAKETGQAAATIVFENIQKMWRSVLPRARKNGAWFINVECEPQLDSMMIGTGTSATLVYMPPGGISGQPYGTIKGRPVIPVEYASGLGDVGDILFADWSQFKTITKGGVQEDQSMHVRFVQRERTFRWVTRISGAPKNKSAITPFKAKDATLRLSDFVTLAAR